MIKKSGIVLLMLVFIICFSSSAFATTVDPDNNAAKDRLKAMGVDILYEGTAPINEMSLTEKKEINDMKKLYGMPEETLNFDSWSQFADFVEQISSDDAIPTNMDSTDILGNLPQSKAIMKTSGTVGQYAPFTWGNGLFCWKNVGFSCYVDWYSLAGYYIVKSSYPITCNSYLSGIIGVTWHQTAFSNSLSTDAQKITFKVNGYYLFAIQIGGIPIGAAKTSSWNLTTKNITNYV